MKGFIYSETPRISNGASFTWSEALTGRVSRSQLSSLKIENFDSEVIDSTFSSSFNLDSRKQPSALNAISCRALDVLWQRASSVSTSTAAVVDHFCHKTNFARAGIISADAVWSQRNTIRNPKVPDDGIKRRGPGRSQADGQERPASHSGRHFSPPNKL